MGRPGQLDVGRDAAAATHGPAMIGVKGLERILPGAGDAAEGAVLLGAQAVVAPLDEAAAGLESRVDGQPYDVARRGEEDRLHERFAERAAPSRSARSWSWSDAARASAALALPPSTRTISGAGGELAVALGDERRVDFLLPPAGAGHHRVSW